MRLDKVQGSIKIFANSAKGMFLSGFFHLVCMLETLVARMKAIRGAFAAGRALDLRQIANDSLTEAAMRNDEVVCRISVIAYCLHKFLSKEHIQEDRGWPKIRGNILALLDGSLRFLEKAKMKEFESQLDKIGGAVRKADAEMGNYVQNLYDKAKVKQASAAYGLGLSLSQAAALAGANKKELLNYIGVTKMHDELYSEIGIRERLKKLNKALGEA
jgi:hypothetical protein